MSKKEDNAYKSWYNNPIYKVGKKKNSYWSSWSKWSFDDDLYGSYDDGWSSLYSSTGVTRTNKDKNKKACEDALRAVSRSANVILNSGDNERRLSVKYSDGSNSNTVQDNVIYISPDKLVSAVDDKDKRNDIVDSFCGQVMLSSQIKRQVDSEVYNSFKKQEDHDVCSLWSAIELAVARSSVIADWAGFKPYFDSYAITSTDASATAIKKMLSNFDGSSEERPTSASAFIKGLAWNLYMSHAPIKIPSVYDKGKALLAEGLSKVRTSVDRWKLCNEVVRELRLMFDPTPPPSGPGEGGVPEGHSFPDDELMGLLDPVTINATEKEDKRKKKGADKFSGIDRELFGLDPIANKKCSSAKTIDAVTGDKSSEAKDTVSAPDVPNIDGDCSTQSKPVWLPPDIAKPGARLGIWKPDRLKMMEACAEKLKDSFNFKSSDVVRRVYGYQDGVLHDGSLYKVPVGLDSVFYKKSRSESDKVAVCLLIDQSGSMSNSSSSESSHSRINDAAQVSYVLAKLCKSVRNLNLSIIGFSAQENSHAAKAKGIACNDELDLRLIYDDEDPNTSLNNILDMRAHSNNTDGYAIWYAARHLSSAKADYKRKVMIVVSDGTPNANGYGGDSAYTHVNLCKTDAKRRFGVETYAIGVDNAYSKRIGDKMYGAGNNIVISDVKSSLGYISRFLSQVAESVS